MILRRDAGIESELEMEVVVAMVTVKVSVKTIMTPTCTNQSNHGFSQTFQAKLNALQQYVHSLTGVNVEKLIQ